MILKNKESEDHLPIKKLKVGAVSYLNTKPLIYGFEQGMMQDEMELLIDYPSNIAKALIDNQIDIGLVPVAIIPELKQHFIISDYCISSDGAVESVGIFSEVPIEEIDTVLLDYQSRTSVVLAQVLLKEYWKLSPIIKKARPDFEQDIKGKTAAVVIGDRALKLHGVSRYYYDLGLAWKEHTGLPFVFAAWISNKNVNDSFIKNFNKANEVGLSQLDKVIARQQAEFVNLEAYYTKFIQYRLTDEKRAGLELFLKKCGEAQTVV